MRCFIYLILIMMFSCLCSLGVLNAQDILTNNGELEFYGKVADQNGGAVPSAANTYHIINYDRAYDNYHYYKTVSDKEGNIKIKDVKAGKFGIDLIECPGYESKKFNKTFEYGKYSAEKFIPDPKKPSSLHSPKEGCGACVHIPEDVGMLYQGQVG